MFLFCFIDVIIIFKNIMKIIIKFVIKIIIKFVINIIKKFNIKIKTYSIKKIIKFFIISCL